METFIIEVQKKKDIEFLIALTKRLGFRSRRLSTEEKEDYFLGQSIEENRKGEYTDKETVLKELNK